MCVSNAPSTQSTATAGCWCSTTNQLNCSTVIDCSSMLASPTSSVLAGEVLSLAMFRRAEASEWRLRGMSGDSVMISPCMQTTPHHSTAQHSTSQHITAHHSTSHHTTARHSTAQHITAHHTTPHHSTVQHSTPQYKCSVSNKLKSLIAHRGGSHKEVR